MNEHELIEQVFENQSKKLASDRIQIETAAINAQTAALERLTEARNRHAEALEREAKALREFEDARAFAEIDAHSRKPPSRVLGIAKRKRG